MLCNGRSLIAVSLRNVCFGMWNASPQVAFISALDWGTIVVWSDETIKLEGSELQGEYPKIVPCSSVLHFESDEAAVNKHEYNMSTAEMTLS